MRFALFRVLFRIFSCNLLSPTRIYTNINTNKHERAHLKSFTLLEVLIVISILAILTTLVTGFYRNYAKNVELDAVAKEIIAELKFAREKAIAGEDDRYWGIHFINSTSDSYELFSNTSASYTGATITQTIFLPGAIIFTTPGEGVNLDVIFNKITGTTNANAITITSENNSKTITATSIGNIY